MGIHPPQVPHRGRQVAMDREQAQVSAVEVVAAHRLLVEMALEAQREPVALDHLPQFLVHPSLTQAVAAAQTIVAQAAQAARR